jgi:hypothetical protein
MSSTTRSSKTQFKVGKKIITIENQNIIEMKDEVIFVKDKNGGYTAWFKEIPDVISQGETKKEAYHNLILTLHDIVKWAGQKHKDCGFKSE